MKTFKEFKEGCEKRETDRGMRLSGMYRECKLMAGPARCNVLDCPKWNKEAPV